MANAHVIAYRLNLIAGAGRLIYAPNVDDRTEWNECMISLIRFHTERIAKELNVA